jgi:hypothetical protein
VRGQRRRRCEKGGVIIRGGWGTYTRRNGYGRSSCNPQTETRSLGLFDLIYLVLIRLHHRPGETQKGVEKRICTWPGALQKGHSLNREKHITSFIHLSTRKANSTPSRCVASKVETTQRTFTGCHIDERIPVETQSPHWSDCSDAIYHPQAARCRPVNLLPWGVIRTQPSDVHCAATSSAS